MDVAGGGEGQVDGAEEQVRRRQADHEQRRRVRTQLRAPQQRHHSQQVACNQGGAENVQGVALLLPVFRYMRLFRPPNGLGRSADTAGCKRLLPSFLLSQRRR